MMCFLLANEYGKSTAKMSCFDNIAKKGFLAFEIKKMHLVNFFWKIGNKNMIFCKMNSIEFLCCNAM